MGPLIRPWLTDLTHVAFNRLRAAIKHGTGSNAQLCALC